MTDSAKTEYYNSYLRSLFLRQIVVCLIDEIIGILNRHYIGTQYEYDARELVPSHSVIGGEIAPMLPDSLAIATENTGIMTLDLDQQVAQLTDFGTHRLYLGGDAYSAPAVYVKENEQWKLYFICRDYLGSITHIANADGSLKAEYSYDAWGRMRDPETQEVYELGAEPTLFLGRGYTGHEHLPWFGLINMNARLYDPALGRFLAPDPYVQAPDFTQNFNRYSYCVNNPFAYTDPNGESFTAMAIIIGGGLVGAYIGGSMANEGELNPMKWDFKSGKTWRYMIGGYYTGVYASYIGGLIMASSIPFANTIGIMASSLVSSMGTHIYTNGETPISISFGAASYDITNNKWNYLGKEGNSTLLNVGYALGGLGNLSDLLIGLNPKKVDLVTEHSDELGHSAIVETGTLTQTSEGYDINSLISFGPKIEETNYVRNLHWMEGTNNWPTHSSLNEITWRNSLTVNYRTIKSYSNYLNTHSLNYSLEISSCVTHTSLALNLSGLFNIGIHPYLLNLQMYLWANGFRPWLYTYNLVNL